MAAVSKSPPDTPATTDPEAPEPKPGASSLPAKAAAKPAVEPGREPRAYEYAWPDVTVYQHIPLTAHPLIPAVPARQGEDEVPAVPEVAATVYAFVDPPDSRWAPTDKTVNQVADNEPPMNAAGV